MKIEGGIVLFTVPNGGPLGRYSENALKPPAALSDYAEESMQAELK